MLSISWLVPVESYNIWVITSPNIDGFIIQTIASSTQVIDFALSEPDSFILDVCSLEITIIGGLENHIKSLVGVEVNEDDRDSEEVEVGLVSSFWNIVDFVVDNLDWLSSVIGQLGVVVSSVDRELGSNEAHQVDSRWGSTSRRGCTVLLQEIELSGLGLHLVGLSRLWPSHIRANSQSVSHGESVISEVTVRGTPGVLDDPVFWSISNKDDGVVDLAWSLVGQNLGFGALELGVGVNTDRERLLGKSGLHSVAVSVSNISEVGNEFLIISVILGIRGTDICSVVFSLVGVVWGWNSTVVFGKSVSLGLTSSLATVSGFIVGAINIFLNREFSVGISQNLPETFKGSGCSIGPTITTFLVSNWQVYNSLPADILRNSLPVEELQRRLLLFFEEFFLIIGNSTSSLGSPLFLGEVHVTILSFSESIMISVILLNLDVLFLPEFKSLLFFLFRIISFSTQMFPILPSIMNMEFMLLFSRSIGMMNDLVRIFITQFDNLHGLEKFFRSLEKGLWINYWVSKFGFSIMRLFMVLLEKVLWILRDINGIDDEDKTDDSQSKINQYIFLLH